MDTHDPDNICIFIQYIRFSIIDLILFKLFHIPKEMKQSVIACFLKCCRPYQQHFHIGSSLVSARLCLDILKVPRFCQNALDQLMDRGIHCHSPPASDFLKETGNLFVLLPTDQILIQKTATLPCHTDPGNLFL